MRKLRKAGLAKMGKRYYDGRSAVIHCNRNTQGRNSRRYKTMTINKNMLIGELIQMDELIPQMLMGAGMHCLGCPASQAESLEEACMVHGIDCDDLVSKMNEVLATR